jgi:hypothetical protein
VCGVWCVLRVVRRACVLCVVRRACVLYRCVVCVLYEVRDMLGVSAHCLLCFLVDVGCVRRRGGLVERFLEWGVRTWI